MDLYDYLKDYIYRNESIEKYNLIQSIICQMIYALYCLHSIGITHGDIKPENILVKIVDDKPVLKFIDMDDSQLSLKDPNNRDFIDALPELSEVTSYTMGFFPTKPFEPFSEETDIYAIGIICYMMIFSKYKIEKYDKIIEIIRSSTELKDYLIENNFNLLSEFYFGKENEDIVDTIFLKMISKEESNRLTAEKLYNERLVKDMCREVNQEEEILEDNSEISGLVEEPI